ncbi:hypothetical protein ACF0H5_007562 [Mactra antiquata]
MDKQKKRKSKKKYRHDSDESDEDDYVERVVEKAMRDVDKAMADIRIAEKATKAAKAATSNWSGLHTSGGAAITVNNYTATNGKGPVVFVNNAQNVQVGNGNVMNVGGYSKSKNKTSKERKARRSSSGSDKNKNSTEPVVEPVASMTPTDIQSINGNMAQQNNVPPSDNGSSEMSPLARKYQPLLQSNRSLTENDISLCTVCIGQFTRFLRMLGIADNRIDALRQEYHSSKEIIYQGITQWKREVGDNATVGALCKVLVKIENTDAMNYLTP